MLEGVVEGVLVCIRGCVVECVDLLERLCEYDGEDS